MGPYQKPREGKNNQLVGAGKKLQEGQEELATMKEEVGLTRKGLGRIHKELEEKVAKEEENRKRVLEATKNELTKTQEGLVTTKDNLKEVKVEQDRMKKEQLAAVAKEEQWRKKLKKAMKKKNEVLLQSMMNRLHPKSQEWHELSSEEVQSLTSHSSTTTVLGSTETASGMSFPSSVQFITRVFINIIYQ